MDEWLENNYQAIMLGKVKEVEETKDSEWKGRWNQLNYRIVPRTVMLGPKLGSPKATKSIQLLILLACRQ